MKHSYDGYFLLQEDGESMLIPSNGEKIVWFNVEEDVEDEPKTAGVRPELVAELREAVARAERERDAAQAELYRLQKAAEAKGK